MLIMPILVLFYQDAGLTMADVLLLQAMFSVVIVVLEVPSGWAADVLGRRLSLLLGAVLGTAGFALYTVTHGFWGFLAAEIALGVGASLVSGADSAMLYDSLAALGDEEAYRRMEGRMLSVGNFSEAVAAVIGGLLATISLRVPFVVEAVVMGLSIPCCLLLVEPPRAGAVGGGVTDWRALFRVVGFALWETPALRRMLALAAVMGSSTLTVVWFVQPWLKEAGLPLSAFGVVWAALNATVGLASLRSDAVASRLGDRRTWVILLFLIATGYAAMAIDTSLLLLPGLLLLYVARGIGRPTYVAAINRLTPSDRRATVLSVGSLGTRLLFSVVGPPLGWLSDTYGMSTALVTAGALHFVLGAIVLLTIYRARAEPPLSRVADTL
jgi:MFS family permease